MANVSSSNGLEKRPKLRFPGFDEPWKEIKIGDIFKVTRGNVLSSALVSSEKSNGYTYPVFSSQTKDDGLMGYYNEFLFEDAITWTTDGANAGTVHFRKGKFYCTNVCGVLLNSYGYANRCIAEILGRVSKRYVSYVGNPKLMNNVMSEICIYIPSLAEQSHIDDFLLVLDKKIEKQRQLVDSLKKYKRGVFEAIFSRKLRLVSKEEQRDWKIFKLSDFASRIIRKNNGTTDIPLTISAQYGLIDQRDFFSKVVASADMSGYYLLRKGEYAYNRSTSNDYPFGSIKRLELYDKGAVSTLYLCFSVNENVMVNDFVKWYFESSQWYRSINEICAEGARNHGLLNVPTDGFFNTTHILPTDTKEQTAIATFLSLIQEKLEISQKGLNKLTELRNGLMQQLFI